MVSSNSKSYFRAVEASHRTYTRAIKQARSRQGLMNIYWRHKRQHEQLLKSHLRGEMAQLNKLKKKIK
ncbi:MAG: hypothetical protein E6L00_01900 [Thaumarchaeota archaeon]|nr:MAG: hypothetical protein E6L02_05810 [Nitrososphaerota archaeon]TLX83082.1 MAG: hypothetical protein E6L00_01900 [Nitrososphaerota archaeon]